MNQSAAIQAPRSFRAKVRGLFLKRAQTNASAQTYLLVCAALVLIPHLFQQRPIILAYCVVLLCLQLLILLKKVLPLTHLTRLFLTFVAMVLIFTQPASMMSQNAGVELLLMMLCLKQFEAYASRDITITHGLCLFVLLTAFLYNSSIAMWGYSMLVLYILLFSMKQIEGKRPFSIRSFRPDWSLIKIMGIGLPLATILFILLPRPAGPLWGLPTQSGMARTGLTEKMSPGQIGQLGDNNSVAFRVTFEGTTPPPNQMYWRGPIFTFFDGHTWNNPSIFDSTFTNFNRPQKFAIPGSPTGKALYQYQVLLNPHNKKWLFTLNTNDPAPPNTFYSPVGQLLAKHPITSVYLYTIDPKRPVKRHYTVAPFSKRYLRLPEKYGQRTKQLIKQFRARTNKAKPYDLQIAQLALDFFKNNNFIYTRQPPVLTHDPVDEFLFNTRSGFCEHYASAFTFMMRAAGIPARIVTGYQGADYNPTQDYYIVRQSNAHAWAEVWLQHQGWTRIDPTTVIPPNRIDRTSITKQQSENNKSLTNKQLLSQPLELIGYYLDAIDYQWGLHVVGFDTQSQDILLLWLQDHAATLTYVIVTGIIIFFFILIKWRHPTPHDPVLHAYQQFCNKLSHYGFRRAPYETANQFAQRIIDTQPHWQSQVEPITTLYLNLRYSKSPKHSSIQHLQKQVRMLNL